MAMEEKEAPVNTDGDWKKAPNEERIKRRFFARKCIRSAKTALPPTRRRRARNDQRNLVLQVEEEMTPQEMRVLYEYNAWANHRSLNAASSLPAEQFGKPMRCVFCSVPAHVGQTF